MKALRAPFPYFGGKSRAAPAIWDALGDVPNYVEPFAGSLAVLLGRPTKERTETVNDLDCYLANFWRASKSDPEGVAKHADWPVNEADLYARHQWLVDQAPFRDRMREDPEFFDARIAGWWVWGVSMWIGGGWCSVGKTGGAYPSRQRRRPCLGGSGEGSGMRGVHKDTLSGRRKPDVGAAGRSHTSRRGVVALAAVSAKRPSLSSNTDLGVLGPVARTALVQEFQQLSERLRGVRVCCGDWTRVLTPAVTFGHGLTGVVLDPPYSTKERAAGIYAHDGPDVAEDVRAWAIENGDNPLLRIVLCGYEGEHSMPNGWRVVEWKAAGGFGSHRKDGTNKNAARERLWLSPHCEVSQRGLFDAAASA